MGGKSPLGPPPEGVACNRQVSEHHVVDVLQKLGISWTRPSYIGAVRSYRTVGFHVVIIRQPTDFSARWPNTLLKLNRPRLRRGFEDADDMFPGTAKTGSTGTSRNTEYSLISLQ